MLRASFAPLCFAMFLAAGCAAPTAESAEDPAVDESALSGSTIQVLGSIAPGDSLSAEYSGTPRYRAYSFTAAAGDKVTFKVTSSTGGDALAYILRKNFATIARNDNASGTTKDAEVTAKIATGGTYYVAVRNAARGPATFTVSFDAPPAATSDSPGPACTGGLTSAGLASLFANKPTAGTSMIALGGYTAKIYTRDCSSTAGGCSPWSENPAATVPPSVRYDILVPPPFYRAGDTFGRSGAQGIDLVLRSRVETVDSGVAGFPCYHTLVGTAAEAKPGASTVAMGIRIQSTCSNDGSASIPFDTTVTDTCMKAVKIVDTQRSDFGGGAYVAKQLAVVIDARY